MNRPRMVLENKKNINSMLEDELEDIWHFYLYMKSSSYFPGFAWNWFDGLAVKNNIEIIFSTKISFRMVLLRKTILMIWDSVGLLDMGTWTMGWFNA